MEIRQEGNRPRLVDSSHQNLRRGSFTMILPWETRIRLQTNIPNEVATHLRGLDVLLVGCNIWAGVLLERMVVLVVVEKVTK